VPVAGLAAGGTARTGLLVAAALLCGCTEADPRAALLEGRAQWKVALLSWAPGPEGTLTLDLRVSGPPRTELRRLTFRIVLRDASDSPIGEAWHTLDLTAIRRGGPEDVVVRLTPRQAGIEGLSVDLVPRPTAEQVAFIEELRD
jgi:hypothetical protein